MKSLRILQIQESPHAGGALSYLSMLSDALLKRGHQVTRLHLLPRIFELPQSEVLYNHAAYRYYRKKIKKLNPDIIHIHNSHKFPISLYRACKGFATVKTIHDYWPLCPVSGKYWRNGSVCESHVSTDCIKQKCVSVKHHYLNDYLPKKVERHLLKNIDLITPSLEQQQRLRNYGLVSRHIPYFSNFPRAKGSSTGREHAMREHSSSTQLNNAITTNGKYWLYVGYLDYNKGIHHLIRAFRKTPHEELHIAGDGPAEKHLRQIAPPNVTFHGYQHMHKLVELYDNATSLIIPSVGPETGPIVAIEAMRRGIPILGSDVPGVREMVVSGVNGSLFKPRNPDAILDAMEKVRKNLPTFASGSATLSNKYNEEEHMQKILAIYRQIILAGLEIS